MRIEYNDNKSILKFNFLKNKDLKKQSNFYFIFGVIIFIIYTINTFKSYTIIDASFKVFFISLFFNFILMILTFIIFHLVYFTKYNSEFIPTNTTLIITVITFLPSVALLFLSI